MKKWLERFWSDIVDKKLSTIDKQLKSIIEINSAKQETKILDSSWKISKKIDVFLTTEQYQNIANAVEIIKEYKQSLTKQNIDKKRMSYVLNSKGKPVSKNKAKILEDLKKNKGS